MKVADGNPLLTAKLVESKALKQRLTSSSAINRRLGQLTSIAYFLSLLPIDGTNEELEG
jgi:hypothetical protein